MKTYNKPWEYLKSYLLLFLCWIISVPIVTFTLNLYYKFGVVIAILIGFCSVSATICLYADSAIKLGNKYRGLDERLKNNLANKHFGIYFGIIPTTISYIEVIAVYLSKFGIVKYDFFALYKTLNMYFIPFTYIFSPNPPDNIPIPAVELTPPALIVMAVLPLVFIITTTVAYNIGYKNIDVKQKILYGK